MKKIILILFAVISFNNTTAQKFSLGFNSGSELLNFEAGYLVTEKIVVGGYYSIGLLDYPSAYGAFGRYLFEEKDFISNQFFESSIRPYVQASIGMIQPSDVSFDLDGLSQNNQDSQLGYLGSFGVEILYGKSRRFGSIIELGVGKAPSWFSKINDNFANALNPEANKESDGTGVFNFKIGLRYYL